ncbi:methylated-DNA--[protein]-cysteine S-methyltransferase [Halovulum sp. GXIMD14793]
MNITTIPSPFGRLGIAATETNITALHWNAQASGPDTPLLAEARAQMQAYLSGTLTRFDLPLDPSGTAFEKQVYAAMLAIPLGQTRTYGDLARDLSVTPQAIGQACGANPIPIIIPCHRITATGGLGGFSGAGGVEQKVALLKHEGAYGLLI